MINTSGVKHKLKNIFVNRKSQIKYKKLDMDVQGPKKRSFAKTVANLFQRCLEVFIRFLFRNVFYSDKGKTMPSIKNLLLLEPATVLAMKIRTKKVSEITGGCSACDNPFNYS